MSGNNRQEPDRALSDAERHLSSICLGIVTVATAAIGVALFTSDLANVDIPGGQDPIWIPVVLKVYSAFIAIILYVRLLHAAGGIIVPVPAESRRNGFSPQQQAKFVYTLFFGELMALIALLIFAWLNELLIQVMADSEAAAAASLLGV